MKTPTALLTNLALLASALAQQSSGLSRRVAASNIRESDHYAELSKLPLQGGYPSKATSRTLDEELFFQRACQVYLWALPAMNMAAMRTGLGGQFGYGYNIVAVYEKRLKPNTLITTPNSDVIYGLAWADLSKTGPLVIEVPARLQGLMDDMWHRPLAGPVIEGNQHFFRRSWSTRSRQGQGR